MATRLRDVTLLLSAMVTAACADVVTGTQGDASAPDAADAGTPVALCTVTPVVDATRVGEVRGRVTRVSYTEADLARGAPMPPSEGCAPPLATTHRLVVRYTVGADAYVNVARGDVPWNTPHAIGRVVMLDGCGTDARRVACGGPHPFDDAPYVQVLAASPTRLRAGTVLTIAVALEAGAGALDVTEVPEELAPEAPCDPQLRTSVCAPGASCADGRCLRDGTQWARCRRGGAPCDAGLRCEGGTVDGYAGRCTPTVPVGARCEDYAVCEGDVCAAGEDGASYCVRDPGVHRARFALGARCDYNPEDDRGVTSGATGGCADGARCALTRAGPARCVRPGRRDAPCEGLRLRCDEGLACVAVAWSPVPVCVEFPAALATCDPRGGPVCGEGTTCRDRGDGLGICLHDGSPTAPCGFAGCDDPNVCIGGRCAAPLAAGAPCAAPGECGAGADCVARVCVARGTTGSTCRVRPPACDVGLACSEAYRCAPAAALGAPCGADAACVDYVRCDATCRATGAQGGWCRPTSPACDAGLACVSNSGDRPPVCLPRLALGDACASRPEMCAPGAVCSSEGPAPRCAPVGAPMPCDRAGACGPRGRCARRWCVPATAAGEACTPGALCADGAACVGGLCVSLGTLGQPCGAGVSCDAGQRCATWSDGLATPACVVALPPGAACVRGCGFGATCVSEVCVSDGALDAACRDGAVPCDAGLACYGGVCRRSVGAGELCGFARGPACAAGLACRFVEPDTRCRAPLYDVSTREGVALDNPCDAPPSDLVTPMTIVIDGEAHGVEVTPAGQVVLRRAGSVTTSSLAVISPDVPLVFGNRAAQPGCVRVMGAAPSRRVVVNSGPSGRGLHPSVADWELALYEGTHAIELRYGAALPGGRVWATPMLATRLERWPIGPVRVRAGTAVRLTPR